MDTKAFPLTVITPIHRGWSWLTWLVLFFLQRKKLHSIERLRFIHFARWTVLPADAFGEFFKRPYMLFSSNYNGPWDQYIDAFSRVPPVGRGVWWIWRTSHGFPGPKRLRRFKHYIRYHEIPVDAYYHAYPSASVRDIAKALKLKEAFADFLKQHGPDPSDDDVRDFVDRHAALFTSASAAKAPSIEGAKPIELRL